MLADKSLREVLDAFASSEPTPGGGSAAAMIGALGASLLAMVAGLPKTKTGTDQARQALDSARTLLLAYRDELLALIDKDAAAYDLVVTAYRKPKGTDEEKAARSKAIQDAMRVAAETPVETMRACAKVMEAATAVAEHGNPSAQSDIAVAAQSVGNAMQAALFNVEINLGSIKDQTVVDKIVDAAKQISGDASEAAGTIMQEANVVELMRAVAKRVGMHHAAPPEPGTPEHTERFAAMAAESLIRLGTDEARHALDVLAHSSDAQIAARARQVLDRPAGS
ncbi:MAG TPA: cyclodeaminase/cyclohydrolase family protein [Vicinamibacterales bacterium]|nr:cyclodeaminase/cyclohydrolase family protein [Vicinamibacterales bacterium]